MDYRKTGLLGRTEGSIPKLVSDYHSVNGVLLPFLEKKSAGSNEFDITYTNRTLRPHLENAAFAVPFRKDYTMPPSGEVTVPAERGLIFQSKINGKGPFETLFDTGAVNFMSANFAHRLGLKLDTEGIKFGTSSPASIQVHKAHVDTLQIGDVVLHIRRFIQPGCPTMDPATGALLSLSPAMSCCGASPSRSIMNNRALPFTMAQTSITPARGKLYR